MRQNTYRGMKRLESADKLTCNNLVAYNKDMKNDDAVFKALNDSTRRLILDEMAERHELTLYELSIRLISKHKLDMSRQAIAKHLALLDEAGLVKSERKGKYRVLRYNSEPLKNLLNRWID
ncbi:DNA-binding transcriptional regulator, ArsR family [Planococcus glaciei]|nr:DNA-binding transcriptional regulator, ArsR family [Planococcus glaciei]